MDPSGKVLARPNPEGPLEPRTTNTVVWIGLALLAAAAAWVLH